MTLGVDAMSIVRCVLVCTNGKSLNVITRLKVSALAGLNLCLNLKLLSQDVPNIYTKTK